MARYVQDYRGSEVDGSDGLEVEFYLIDKSFGWLANAALELLILIWSNRKYARLRPIVTPEYLACMIELKTGANGLLAADLPRVFPRDLRLLLEAADDCGLMLLPTAHYPGANDELWNLNALPLFSDPGGRFEENGLRYARLLHNNAELQVHHRIAACVSMQAHFGYLMQELADQEVLVGILNGLTTLVPAFAAIGANSPSFTDPTIDSERLAWWPLLRRSGARLFPTYADLKQHLAELMDQGLIDRITELWYFNRPNEASVEAREIDMQPTLGHLLGMKALVHCCAAAFRDWIRDGKTLPLPSPADLREHTAHLSTLSLERPWAVPVWDFTWGANGRWSTLGSRLGWLFDFAQKGVGDTGQDILLSDAERWASSGRNGAALMRGIRSTAPTPQQAHLAAATLFAGSVELARVT